MNLDPQMLLELQKLIPLHRGVFTISDLKNFFLTKTTIDIQKRLRPFLNAKILTPFCRGFYVTQGFNLEYLSQRICPESALSMGTVLAKNMLIGSIPQKTVYAVKRGKTRIYKSEMGQIVHFGFASPMSAKDNWFGYAIDSNGIRRADPEKAFLDTLYFYQLGNWFSFNIYSDIHVNRLNDKKLGSYLKKYRNPKFRKFVEGVIDGYYSQR